MPADGKAERGVKMHRVRGLALEAGSYLIRGQRVRSVNQAGAVESGAQTRNDNSLVGPTRSWEPTSHEVSPSMARESVPARAHPLVRLRGSTPASIIADS